MVSQLDVTNDTCYNTGMYDGNFIDFVPNIYDATSCEKKCNKHSHCQYWTYNEVDKKCWRHEAKPPNSNPLDVCNDCKCGPILKQSLFDFFS